MRHLLQYFKKSDSTKYKVIEKQDHLYTAAGNV